MLGDIGIGKRLAMSFGLLVAVFLLSIGVAIGEFAALRSGASAVKQRALQLAQAQDAYAHALQAMTYTGAAAAAEQPLMRRDYLDLVQAHSSASRKALAALQGSATTGEARKLTADLDATLSATWETNEQILQLIQADKGEEAFLQFSSGSCPQLRKWEKAFGKVSALCASQMNEAITKADAQATRGTWILVLAAVIAVAAAAGLGLVITRSVTGPVQGFMGLLDQVAAGDLRVRAAVGTRDEVGRLGGSLNRALEHLQDMVRQVAGAAAAVANGATELSATAEQMAISTQEIAKGGELLRGATDSVSSAIVQFSASVEQVAGNVRTSVDQTGQAVQATEEGAQGGRDAAERMARIHEATSRISSAVLVIQEIAGQTNLLSLNAAIEAAKAGDRGRGFAVVAEEVRKLAERSRAASVEIEQVIHETQGAVAGGVASVEATGALMRRIQETIAGIASRVGEIGGATREQTATAGEIAQRMEESARQVGHNAAATQQLSATVQEISRTAAELAKISESLAQGVAAFQV